MMKRTSILLFGIVEEVFQSFFVLSNFFYKTGYTQPKYW